MRTREKIISSTLRESPITGNRFAYKDKEVEYAILEVLLDIRDLLSLTK